MIETVDRSKRCPAPLCNSNTSCVEITPRNSLRACVLIMLAVCVYGIHIKADIFPVASIGDAIPGTANFRLTGLSQAVVNPSGTIAFHAWFTDPATNLTGEGIFKIDADGSRLSCSRASHFPMCLAPRLGEL